MFRRLTRAAAPLLVCTAAPLAAEPAAPVAAADLMRHIEVLASDAYGGRMPGTESGRMTAAYIAAALQARGLEPAGPDGSWYQPVELVERSAAGHQAAFASGSGPVALDPSEIMLLGRGEIERIEGAPVVFAGHGVSMPERGIDQLAGADLAGAVALILLQGPDIPGFPDFEERARNLTEAGAAAVIAILGPQVPWEAVSRNFGQKSVRLASSVRPPVIGAVPFEVAARLVAAAGADLAGLLDAQPGSSFRAVPLPIRATLDVRTAVRPFASPNVVGKVAGSGGSGEAVLLLGHWDHLGICRPEGAEDRICNGAVDNASGIAVLIEAAGRIAAGPRPERDVLVLATTAEEMGLLGAQHFVARPTVPLDRLVAAVNLDTVALHPAGGPVAVIGRGIPPLDAAIAAAAGALGRTVDAQVDTDALVTRQDGWAFARAGVPAIMVGGAIADMERLGAFLSGPYHGPEDEIGPGMVLEGAAEDTALIVALLRRLADPGAYTPPATRD